jgi:sensor histidine kinase regulating citrate/malate metabolism
MFFGNRTDKKMAAFQADLIDKHYAEVENMYKQVRGWRHDYKNHIQTLKAYMSVSEYDKVNAYLDRLDEDLTSVDTIMKTGNLIIDAILNSKISLAKSKEIAVNARAFVPKNLNISEIDLCVIIGNLLDNAIEACEKITTGEKFVRVFIGIKNTQLYIFVANTAPGGKLTKVNGRFATKKSWYHGFGLARIDKTVEKYKGYVKRSSEDGAFTTEILLPI